MDVDASLKRNTLLVSVLTSFLTPFIASSVAVALPRIGTDLAMDAISLSWVETAYLLSAAAFLVPMGRVSDIYGRKKVFLCGMTIGSIASVLALLSASGTGLIVWRVFQGLGSSMVFGTGIAIITSVYPFSERGKALGIVLTSVYVGLSAGPLLGGLLTDHFGWKSIFCANVIIGVVVIVTTLRKIKGEWAEAKGERFDIIGSLLYIVFFTVAILGFTSLPSVKGLALLALGTAGLVVFVFWELRIQNPILHIAFFMKNRVFLFSNIATLVNYSATFAVTFLMSLYLQLVKGFSSQAAGLILVFQPSMQAALSGLTGRISDRVEPRIVSSLGMTSLSIGLFILSFLTESTAIYVIVLNLLFLGFGFALFVTPNTNAIMSSVERKYYGVASGAMATMRVIGQTLSMSIVMFVFVYTMGKTHITPENHNEFMLSVRAILLIFACLSCLGVFASLARGKMHNENKSIQDLGAKNISDF